MNCQAPSNLRRLRRLFCLLVLVGLAATPACAADQATIQVRTDHAVAKPGETVVLDVVVTVVDGFHVQSHTPSEPTYIPLTVSVDGGGAAEVGPPEYPAGKDETYPGLGTLNVYTGSVTVRVPVKIKRDAGSGRIDLHGTVRYQACNDTACFPPKKPKFEVAIDVEASAGTTPASTRAATRPADTTDAAVTDAPPPPMVFGFALGDDAYVLAFVAAFLAGIVFNAVPCVLPVVPLKIAGFYEAAQHDRRRCFLLGLAFSAGLVASFAVLAVLVVGLRTLTWGGLFQQTWFTVSIVVVLTVMAASQFGLFTIQLPTSAYAFTPRHDTLVGNALFGVLTAALSTPCTIGPFSVLLAWALRKPPALGAAVVIVVGCGMAAPYLVLSAFPQVVRRFPRTGAIGEIVKQTLAFFVLGTAFYFARPFLNHVLTPLAFWWTLFAFAAAAGVFLVVRTIRSVGTPRAIRASTAIALIAVAGAAWGTRRLAYDPYEWQPYSAATLADAVAKGRTVLVDFTADWCGNCHYLEAFVINDASVGRAVRDHDVLMLRADVTHGTEPAVALKDELIPTGEIPLTAVYRPRQTQPTLLSGVYGTHVLIDAIQRR